MHHALLVAVTSLVIGLPLLWLGRRGWFGSTKAFSLARDELRGHGRVLLVPTMVGRTLGIGPMVLDRNGLTINAWRSRRFYSWSDIPKPFTLHSHKSNSSIRFLHRAENQHHGHWRLFRNTRDKFLDTKQTISSAYGMGWDNLLRLLNEARVFEASEELRAGLFQPQPVLVPEVSAGAPVPVVRPARAKPFSAIPDWAIKFSLAVAVVTAFGYMVPSFSWMHTDPTLEVEPMTVAVERQSYENSSPAPGSEGAQSPQVSNINPKEHVVHGYARKNGTYVAPYIATNPDHDKTNNFSSRNNSPFANTRAHR